MDPYVQSIISEPGFDAQSFIKAVMIDQHASVFTELLREEPSLFLVEVAGPDGKNILAANVFSRTFQDVPIPKDVLYTLSEKYKELKRDVFARLVTLLPEHIDRWIEFGLSPKKAGEIFRITKESMTLDQYEKLFGIMSQNWEKTEIDPGFVARFTPEGHENLLDLAMGKHCRQCERSNKKGSFAVCDHSYHAAVKMTIKQRLNFLVEHIRPTECGQYWLARFIRQITPKTKIYCPKCHEKVKSWPGLTLHLQSAHNVPKDEYKDYSKGKTSVYENMACEGGRRWNKRRGKYMDLIEEVKEEEENA